MKFISMMASALFLTFSAHAQTAAPSTTPPSAPTANQVIDEIKSHIGIPWMAQTVDTFKAGDPETRVTGIAVTMMATLDVLQRAAANRTKPDHHA